MSQQQLRNVNFGLTFANHTGSSGVGYSILDNVGNLISARTTNVYQLTSGSGIFAAYITFPDTFHGQILWDTGTHPSGTKYATEQFNVEENSPLVEQIYNKLVLVSGSIETIKDYSEGKWKIINNQMIFYKANNSTEVARFNLFDDAGLPTEDAVFERVRV